MSNPVRGWRSVLDGEMHFCVGYPRQAQQLERRGLTFLCSLHPCISQHSNFSSWDQNLGDTNAAGTFETAADELRNQPSSFAATGCLLTRAAVTMKPASVWPTSWWERVVGCTCTRNRGRAHSHQVCPPCPPACCPRRRGLVVKRSCAELGVVCTCAVKALTKLQRVACPFSPILLTQAFRCNHCCCKQRSSARIRTPGRDTPHC